MLLQNKVAIITGAARGIGRGIAVKFAEEGCSCVVADILEKEAAVTVAKIADRGQKGLFVECDVSDSRRVSAMVDRATSEFGHVDILVNNASIGGTPKFITDKTEEEWDRLLAINLKGMFLCSKAIVPHMIARKHGKIINISSVQAISPPAPNIEYSASKAGILGLTLDLAFELAPLGICVNAILPGAVPTDMWNIVPPGVDRERFFAEVGKVIAPMQRCGTPEDIAGAAIFLASDLSNYVTGDRIIVAGGAPLLVSSSTDGKFFGTGHQ
ncbi:MAG: SDR family NAD(P)-dependent oxidoreductase [Syntrophorhabdales bacterium]|jgi:NAD(P)-dependent dehydrogenase (short-subunit alcohol dehydrogenase family)